MEKKKKNTDSKEIAAMKTTTTNDMLISVEGNEGRVYKFYMPFYSPLPECYDAAVNVASEIARLFNEAIKKQQEKEEKKAN